MGKYVSFWLLMHILSGEKNAAGYYPGRVMPSTTGGAGRCELRGASVARAQEKLATYMNLKFW